MEISSNQRKIIIGLDDSLVCFLVLTKKRLTLYICTQRSGLRGGRTLLLSQRARAGLLNLHRSDLHISSTLPYEPAFSKSLGEDFKGM